jgi:hypothetical protein
MSKKNQTPTNETPVNNPSKPDVVFPPQNVYIQNSQDMPDIIIKVDVKLK